MNWHLGASLTFALVVLGCDSGQGGGDNNDGSTSGGSGETGNQTTPTTSPSTTGPTDCIAGQESCACLEGDCIGTLFCVEDMCVPGPQLDVPGSPIRVIAGLRVPIDAEVSADDFGWEQTGGPQADFTGADSQSLLVDVPAGLSGGDTLTFTLSATRNDVPASVEVTIEIVEAAFEEGLPTIADPEQLGTPTSISFRGGQLWAVSNEGFVSWFDLDTDDAMVEVATHLGRHDIPGGPIGARMGQVPGRDDDIDVLLVANATSQALESVAINGGSVETLSDETVDGEPLGPVRHLTRMDDEIYMTNGESGQLLVWDPDPPEVEGDGSSTGDMAIPAGTRVLLDGLAMPSAVITGPEPGYLYVGTSGQVLRVPILQDGSAGDPDVYLDFGDTLDPNLMVDGLMFDRANNLYAGVPLDGRLLVARYEGSGSTTAIRDLDSASPDFSGFSGLAFGDDDFGRGTLYYGNASGRVGRVFVGLGR